MRLYVVIKNVSIHNHPSSLLKRVGWYNFVINFQHLMCLSFFKTSLLVKKNVLVSNKTSGISQEIEGGKDPIK